MARSPFAWQVPEPFAPFIIPVPPTKVHLLLPIWKTLSFDVP